MPTLGRYFVEDQLQKWVSVELAPRGEPARADVAPGSPLRAAYSMTRTGAPAVGGPLQGDPGDSDEAAGRRASPLPRGSPPAR
jgi:hypothetical protein